MSLSIRQLVRLTLVCLLVPLVGCKPKANTDPSASDRHTAADDLAHKEEMDYRAATRKAYNNRRFDDLDQNADEVRASKAKFGNGSWKIFQFYDSLACSDSEPESMWQLPATIHRDWIAVRPSSVTAHVAQVAFLLEYVWHARGIKMADQVPGESWQIFGERLKAARQSLIDCRNQGMTCPVWWQTGQRIALGEQWRREDYDRFYAQAKAFEPTYWGFDTSRSRSSGMVSRASGKRRRKVRRTCPAAWAWRCTPDACSNNTTTTTMCFGRPRPPGTRPNRDSS